MSNPWESLGISKATYYRRESQKVSPEVSVSPESHQNPEKVSLSAKIVFDGTNGNVCGNITRKEMKIVLDAGGKFIPNWYSAGCLSKLGVLTGKG